MVSNIPTFYISYTFLAWLSWTYFWAQDRRKISLSGSENWSLSNYHFGLTCPAGRQYSTVAALCMLLTDPCNQTSYSTDSISFYVVLQKHKRFLVVWLKATWWERGERGRGSSVASVVISIQYGFDSWSLLSTVSFLQDIFSSMPPLFNFTEWYVCNSAASRLFLAGWKMSVDSFLLHFYSQFNSHK